MILSNLSNAQYTQIYLDANGQVIYTIGTTTDTLAKALLESGFLAENAGNQFNSIETIALAANVGEYNEPNIETVSGWIFNASGGGNRLVDGITPPSGFRTYLVVNGSTDGTNLRLRNQNGNAPAASQFFYSANKTLAPNESVEILYDPNIQKFRILDN